ncbi:uncharacterized protein LOC132717244 [Ruditapes philippinarum]|uniref:uncharacterized protein LOC132717244 n=1 Tax=Ruditapes philippinarum TaxID=129788 RepID=UPI00295B7109|nr:uncharacterized protein LOC132717244 [Ruditapes philippinarum]XP_060556661.1 uncharacterized protein LOC132717244 [Ruditapes philippinarum]
MEERVGSVMRVLNAMEELDHSELTRGNVKAATRAVESMHTEMIKYNNGVGAKTDSFSKLLSMAERGNWTELRNARTNGLMPTARQELEELIGYFTKKPASVTPSIDKPSKRNTPTDRGYPPQHTEESERAYNRRRMESQFEHRDRRTVEPSYSATPSDYDRYELRRRDDPKQVSDHLSQLASERLRNGKATDLEEVTSPKHVADMFNELYNREWTAAYEELQQMYRDPNETIQHLTKIIKSAYDYCGNTAERQIVNIMMHTENEMLYPNISQQSRAALEAQVRPDRQLIAIVRENDAMLRDFRKYASVASLPVVKWLFYEDILKTIHPAQRPTNSQVAFIDRCIEVIWMMCTQANPMHLEFCNKGDRPTSLFKPFTRSGNAVQNCVWPALFLHKNGPLMEKGVAHLH